MAIAHRDIAGLLKKRGYSEIKKIGEGSFGKAILVECKDGNKLVCKMVDVSKASPKEQRAALQEGQLLSSLKHPYIVRYRENFTESGWLCILMDYCEGGDLTKLINTAKKGHKPFSEDQVLRYFTQGILGLKYIHDKHILHRDLKPSNFFIGPKGVMQMGDFGIAKVLDSTIAHARTQIGTPYYLSPEVCQEKPYAWPSDIWAMGCILYEMCTLKVPFDASNILGLVQKITKGPTPKVPNTYSEFVRDLCSEMLNRNPLKRPSPQNILDRPKIQSIVRQMWEEAQQAGSSEEDKSARMSPPPASARMSPQPAVATPSPAVASADRCPHADNAKSAGTYRQNDRVEYHSSTHNSWLPATVLKVDCDGRITIDLKPNTWISLEEQAAKIRHRRKGSADSNNHRAIAAVATPMRQASHAVRETPRAHATPMQQRSPSAGALERQNTPAANASPQRSPSVGSLPMRQRSVSLPGSTPRAMTPGRGRDNSPARIAGAVVGSNSPRRSPSSGSHGASPRAVGGGPYPGGGAPGVHDTPRICPPRIPRAPSESPLRRRNACAGAAGAVIAGT